MRTLDTAAVRGFVLTLLLAPALLADGPQTGTIDGRVLDPEGEALPGVTVTLAGPQGEQMMTTGADGSFRFGLVNPGPYVLGARLEGLGSTELATTVTSGQRQTLTVRLRPETTETITVTAETPLVDKYAVGSSAALEAAVAQEITFKGRNYQSSFEVLPGVVHDGQSRLTGDIQFGVNGGNHTEVAGFVDGVDTSFARFGGSQRLFLPTTALTEVRLDSAGFGVEYGRVVGGVTQAVVKSGTNQFHGDFLWIPQSQKWRAPYDALDIPRDDEIINSFETSLGGPMMRDRAWFFAAYAEQDTNEVDQLRDGSTENVGFQNVVKVLKLNFQPSSRHYLSVLGVDSPIEKVQINAQSADTFSPCACNLEGEILTANWGYSISPSLFLEVKAADQQNDVIRNVLRSREIVPGANPHSPIGNNFPYVDLNGNQRYNTIAQPLGEGYIQLPRRQANGSLSFFQGNHELKLGADYQDIEMQQRNVVGMRFNGRGFNANLPSGFTSPQFADVFDPAGEIATKSEIQTVYVQDRIALSERWTLGAGLRLDDQVQKNDVGQEASSFTEVAPRLSAVYDVDGSGKLLVKANAGRYYQIVSQDTVSREFAQLPTGTNTFDRFGWNPATQRYDIFQSRFVPAAGAEISDIDPYYKDEASVGVEWQFSRSWAFEAQAIAWEQEDIFLFTNQFDANGIPYRDIRNWDDAYREYRGLRLELNRAFRDHWTLRTNYTLGKTEGNSFGNNSSSIDNDALFEALGGVEVSTGRTDATIINRDGRGPFDRKHNVNVVGLKQWPIGSHNIGVGTTFSFRSGERWGSRPNTMVRHPVSGRTINTNTYREPRDASAMEDTFNLNLTGTWTFPINGQVRGRLGVEAANVTNEQEIISINVVNGQPDPGKFGIQAPREIRFQLGVTF